MYKLKKIGQAVIIYGLLIVTLAGFTVAISNYHKALEYYKKVEYLKEIADIRQDKNISSRVAIDDGKYTLTIELND